MENKFDYIVRNALSDEVNEISNTEDIFCRIKDKIMMKEVRESGNSTPRSAGFGFKRFISVAVCLMIVFTSLIIASFLKTIFISDREGDNQQVVQKPSNEALFTFSVSNVTDKSDEEISSKLGYHVRFPESLGDSYKLFGKAPEVVLKKQLNSETGSKLHNDMLLAIEDDNMFYKLKPYDPAREIFGMYGKSVNETFFINISRTWTFSERINEFKNSKGVDTSDIQKVKIGNIDGYWIKAPYSKYPSKMENGQEKLATSATPVIFESYYLLWEKAGTVYGLDMYGDSIILPLDEAVKIAEEFMKAN